MAARWPTSIICPPNAGLPARAAVRVRCEGDAGTCAGAIRLRAGGKTLGTGRFEIAAGAKRTISVKLNRRARTLLKASRRARVTLTIAYADGRTERVRVRLTR